ncbi:MAG: hypothetical protein Q8L26_00080 [Candidatus Omnitrophota bacterium]|nr:hypothetical protein [Candidatus Omnitrophota bacterium]
MNYRLIASMVLLGLWVIVVPVWAKNKVQEGDAFVAPEDKKEAEMVFSELPQAEPAPVIEEEETNSVIIKFVQGADLNEVLKKAEIEAVNIEEIKISLPVLDEGKFKEAIANMKALGPEPTDLSLPKSGLDDKGSSQTKSQSSLEKDSDGWYWFLGKTYKEVKKEEQNEDKKELFSLYHKVTLKEGLTAGQAMAKLRNNPSIEYVLPGVMGE